MPVAERSESRQTAKSSDRRFPKVTSSISGERAQLTHSCRHSQPCEPKSSRRLVAMATPESLFPSRGWPQVMTLHRHEDRYGDCHALDCGQSSEAWKPARPSAKRCERRGVGTHCPMIPELGWMVWPRLTDLRPVFDAAEYMVGLPMLSDTTLPSTLFQGSVQCSCMTPERCFGVHA